MFSTFPDGWSGFGLLLLRTVLGGALLISAWEQLQVRATTPPITGLLASIVLIAVGVLIALGYRTRAIAAACAFILLVTAFLGAAASKFVSLESRSVTILLTVISVSVACVGPGAYSLDSRFFGRREIVIPKSSRPHGPT
jgi:uncharacterized membrane protein YphA (DoxX/SURF4 family)